MNMPALLTIVLLVFSNAFMTVAWYGHLRYSTSSLAQRWGVFGLIIISWGIAFFEYCCQVPANRIGYDGNGGPFSLIQLKVIQEVISLLVFSVFATMLFKNEGLKTNHFIAFALLIGAVYFVFKD